MNGKIIAQAELNNGIIEYVVKNNDGTYSNLSINRVNGTIKKSNIKDFENNYKQAMIFFMGKIIKATD